MVVVVVVAAEADDDFAALTVVVVVVAVAFDETEEFVVVDGREFSLNCLKSQVSPTFSTATSPTRPYSFDFRRDDWSS